MSGAADAGVGLGLTSAVSVTAHMEDRTTLAMQSLKAGASVGTKIAGVASPLAGPIGSAVGMFCDSVVDGIDAWNTQKTVANLKKIYEHDLPALGRSSRHYEELKQVLETALKKKRRHRDIVGSQAGTLQIAKPFTQAYRAGRAVYKKHVTHSKGLTREVAAESLMYVLHGNDERAKKVAEDIVEALANKTFHELMQHTLAEALRS